MKVIDRNIRDEHNPHWKFQLGGETYQTKDLQQRVEKIKERLTGDTNFEFVASKEFPERFISKLHPYHDYIKNTSASIKKSDEEYYPDLFPGDRANLAKKSDNPQWGGIWCTDAVTPIMQRTYLVAKASAECALTGAEMLVNKSEKAVYALCRPSGHHAGPRVFGGYCYFNNAAVAAEYLSAHGLVAIIDIDYHHGNGTQEFFEERKFVFTASIHVDTTDEYPYFWGYADETGKGQAKGRNLNIPLKKGTEIEQYGQAVDQIISAFKMFKPDYLIISAGFDTHESDPIGGFKIKTEDYKLIGKKLASLKIPTLICQEGGYNIEVLGDSVHNLLSEFL
ncbi:MAG: histone deacetylase family protein [Candidatus Riflebacteria bacterium]|nr:histone deacetylase family protein [Candidatus Riflebacteria bacterium]